MPHAPNLLIPADFRPDPSRVLDPQISVTAEAAPGVGLIGYAVPTSGPVTAAIGLPRERLDAVGFAGNVGQTLLLPQAQGPDLVAVGVGASGQLTPAELRDAAAAFARSGARYAHLATDLLGAAAHLDTDGAVAAITEGAVLARYRYDLLRSAPTTVPLGQLDILGSGQTSGVQRGLTLARATMLARDLAAAPPAHLTATFLAEFAEDFGPQVGLEVTTFDQQQLIELGCGGLLGVNSGSFEEPRMIQLRYRPDNATAHVAFIGKGIMYDAGGIALKPADDMHATMKTDMSGAAAVLAAMGALQALGCRTAVTGYLMCTDNMPSGSAIALGEVLRAYGGTTIEVKNTDAEGRLVMCDAFGLANEEGVDAIVDIATLTGAALRALGTLMAAVYGNSQPVVDQVLAAAAATDETAWQLPLDRRYRDQLNSDIADISNLGGPNAGSTTAALFLDEFTGGTPWAHIDIAGTAMSARDDSWRTLGPTGFGTRLLAEFAVAFSRP